MSADPIPSWFPTLAGTLGTDVRADSLVKWRDGVWQRDRPSLLRALATLSDWGAAELFPEGATAADIDEVGLRYLCFRTHFLRYSTTAALVRRHRTDVRLLLAVAVAVSGGRAAVPIMPDDEPRGRLIDGSNLFYDERAAPSGERIVFDGGAGTLEVGGCRVPASFASDRVLAKTTAAPWLTALPYDDDFVLFFLERESGDESVAMRHLALELPEQCATQLREIKAHLQARHPTVWEFVRHHVLQINWTFMPELISSTDMSESRGSVLLNGSLPLESSDERVAWLAAGLYHEAKHLQLFDLKQNWGAALASGQDTAPIPLSPAMPRVPCAWFGNPTPRTLGDHLVSLQAFIPGMVVTLTSLIKLGSWSMWSYDSVETVMRGVNGAMGALLLGRDRLTDAGRDVMKIVQRDYEELLAPLCEMAAPDTRV